MNIDEIHPPIPEPFASDGWVYRDIPWMEKEYWNQFIDLVGEENLKLLVMSTRNNCRRGQFFVSPAGMQRIRDRAEMNKDHP